jgi:hypothetical protein
MTIAVLEVTAEHNQTKSLRMAANTPNLMIVASLLLLFVCRLGLREDSPRVPAQPLLGDTWPASIAPSLPQMLGSVRWKVRTASSFLT